MSKQAELQKTIDSLREAIPEIRGVLVASTDGLAIVHSLSSGDHNRVAAMTATALGLGKRIVDTLGAATLTQTTLTGDEGQVFLYSAGNAGVLAVIASSAGNVGLIHLEARDAAQKIAQIISTI